MLDRLSQSYMSLNLDPIQVDSCFIQFDFYLLLSTFTCNAPMGHLSCLLVFQNCVFRVVGLHLKEEPMDLICYYAVTKCNPTICGLSM